MNKTIVALGSVTYALKARKLLRGRGIQSELIKLDAGSKEGCTHGLIIDRDSFYMAVLALKENGISYSVYS